MSLGYTWEKFYVAVETLVGQGSIQDRLCGAYSSALMRLEPKDLPKDLRADFIELERKLTSVEPTGDEGSIAASTKAMSADDAEKLAKQIVSMFNDIARSYPQK